MKERNERIAGWTVTGRGEVPFVIPKKKEEDIKEAWERGRRNWEKVGGGKRKRKRESGSKLHCPQKLEATIAVCLLAPYRLIDTPSNLRNCKNNLSTFRRFNHMPRHCNPRLGTSLFFFSTFMFTYRTWRLWEPQPMSSFELRRKLQLFRNWKSFGRSNFFAIKTFFSTFPI